MKTKCTGIMGRVFGHKWNEQASVVAADKPGPGMFFLHGVGPLMLETKTVCTRCGAVSGEKK